MRYILGMMSLFVALSFVCSFALIYTLATDPEISQDFKGYYKEIYQISFDNLKSEMKNKSCICEGQKS